MPTATRLGAGCGKACRHGDRAVQGHGCGNRSARGRCLGLSGSTRGRCLDWDTARVVLTQRAAMELSAVSSSTDSNGRLPAVCGMFSPHNGGQRHYPNRPRMGLFRLFWMPERLVPAEGTYVRYPSEDFLGILALESQRLEVMVIGEDLGTVAPAIRASLMAGGSLSYRLLLFEQTVKGQFAEPARFLRHAAAAVATHDLPTLRGVDRPGH